MELQRQFIPSIKKGFSFLYGLIFLFLFCRCEEERIRFTEPQPAKVKADPSIRKAFWGRYFNQEDSVWLLISENEIQLSNHPEGNPEASERHNFKGKIQVGSDSEKNVKIEVLADGSADSLAINAHYEESVIHLQKGGVAKFYKGYYFLNTPIEGENTYRLRILQEEGNGMNLFTIQSDSVLHELEKEGFLSKRKAEEGEEEIWTLQPSRQQLKKLMKMGLFAGKIHFEKMD
jgi:hypothetical protein